MFETFSKNFDFQVDETAESRTLMIACRDCTCHHEERWVLAALSDEEARKLYKELGKYFK